MKTIPCLIITSLGEIQNAWGLTGEVLHCVSWKVPTGYFTSLICICSKLSRNLIRTHQFMLSANQSYSYNSWLAWHVGKETLPLLAKKCVVCPWRKQALHWQAEGHYCCLFIYKAKENCFAPFQSTVVLGSGKKAPGHIWMLSYRMQESWKFPYRFPIC